MTASILTIKAWLRDNGDGTWQLITDPAQMLDTDMEITIPYVAGTE